MKLTSKQARWIKALLYWYCETHENIVGLDENIDLSFKQKAVNSRRIKSLIKTFKDVKLQKGDW